MVWYSVFTSWCPQMLEFTERTWDKSLGQEEDKAPNSPGNGIKEGNLKKLVFKLTINVEVEFQFWEKEIPDICLAMAKTESEKPVFFLFIKKNFFKIIALQCCIGFYCRTTLTSYKYTQQLPTSYLFHTWDCMNIYMWVLVSAHPTLSFPHCEFSWGSSVYKKISFRI